MSKFKNEVKEMTKEIAQAKLNAIVKIHSIAMLCELFETTNNQPMTVELSIVRGAIMDELEIRNAASFELWLDCTTDDSDYPSKFFS
jgi:hypothetical protein